MSNLGFCPVPHVNGVMMPAQALVSRHAGTLWEKTVRQYQSKCLYFYGKVCDSGKTLKQDNKKTRAQMYTYQDCVLR